MKKPEVGAICAKGSISTFKNITSDLAKGDSEISILDVDIANLELAEGNLIKIKSSKIFSPTSGENITQGEIQRIKTITTNKIILENSLEDSYLTSDTSQLARVVSGDYRIQGRIKLIQGGQLTSTGMFINLCDTPVGEIIVDNAKDSGVLIQDSYAPDLKINTNNIDNENTGYGLNVANCVMYGRFTGVSTGSRHAVAFGGAGGIDGVNWGNKVINYTGSMSKDLPSGQITHIFDTHKSVGSVQFINCTANGFNGLGSGFSVEGKNIEISNCEANNVESIIAINGAEIDNVYLVNNKGTNNKFGVYITDFSGYEEGNETPTMIPSIINNLTINGLDIKNDVDINDGGLLSFEKATINSWTIKNMSALGIGRFMSIENVTSPSLNAYNINTEFILPNFGHADELNNAFLEGYDNIEYNLTNCTTNAPAFFYNRSGNTTDLINFTNCKSNNPLTYSIYVLGTVISAKFNNCDFNEDDAGYFIGGLEELTVTNTTLNGSDNRGFVIEASPNLKVFESGNTYNNTGYLRLLKDENAFQHILQGSITNPTFLIFTGNPEGSQTAVSPCLGMDRSAALMYKKTSGSGNTGWSLV